MKRENQILFRKLSFMLVAIFMVSAAWAQQSISGKVVDSDGVPLPGVAVVQQGTANGTATNIDGEYTMSAPADAVLQFSFVGMLTSSEQVNGRSTINVTMQPDAIGIEEVVAIGYGTMKKSDLTGSVMSVGADKFEAQPLTTIIKKAIRNKQGFRRLKTDLKINTAYPLCDSRELKIKKQELFQKRSYFE